MSRPGAHAAREIRGEKDPQTGILTYLGLAHFVNDMLTGAVPGLLPGLEAAFGLNYAALGLVVTLQNVTSSIIQPLFGALGDRIPMPWLLPLAPALAAVGLFALGRSPTALAAYAAVLLLGLGSAAFHPEGSRLANGASGSRPGLGQAMFQVGGNLGFAMGPLVASFMLGRGGLGNTQWLLLPGAAMMLVGMGLMGRLRQARPVAPASSAAGRSSGRGAATSSSMWRVSLVALLVIIALRSFVQLGVASFLPLEFAHVRHASAALGDVFSFLFLASGAVGTFVGGILSDRLGSIPIVRLSMALAVPLLFVFPDLHGGWLLADLVVAGFVVLSTFAVTVTLGHAYLPGAVGVSSGLTIGLSVGAGGLGTVLLGALADALGISTTLRLLFVIPLLAFALSWLLKAPAPKPQPRPAMGR